MGLDINSGSVRSIAIKITKKRTEFMFKENGDGNASNNRTRHTLHNSLLDCHAEVWSRFPVVPAVKRPTLTSSSERHQKSITFIAENYSQPFVSYFSDLIQTFETTTRKPTGDELRRINISAKDFSSFQDEVIMDSEWDVSRYRVGEWLVDLLCLIPIHIAVCRENRFIPLADGVLSSDLERSLLGAEVSKIVDKLSFGWYESIFQSYLSSKVCSWVNIHAIRPTLIHLCTARKGCVVNGSTICGEKFLAEPFFGYVICWECHAYHRYSCYLCDYV
jgi:hypothetical protein